MSRFKVMSALCTVTLKPEANKEPFAVPSAAIYTEAFFIDSGERVLAVAVEIVGKITSSASIEAGAAATLTTDPETDETVVVPRLAPSALLYTITGSFAKNKFFAAAPGTPANPCSYGKIN